MVKASAHTTDPPHKSKFQTRGLSSSAAASKNKANKASKAHKAGGSKTNDGTDDAAPSPKRAFWTGSISFGLLQIPVGVYTVEVPQELSFRQLDKRDLSPIGYTRVNKTSGEPVDWKDVAKGYEFAKGEFILISDAEIAEANVEATQTIDIQDFVDVAAVDPIHFERPYYLAPAKRSGKAYALLREALARTKKAAVATVVMRTRQHLCLLYPKDNVLVLEILRFAHELRSAENLALPGSLQTLRVSEKELEMAVRLVENMESAWEPGKYHDSFRDDLLKLIETKAKTGKISAVPKSVSKTQIPTKDLLTLLHESLKQVDEKAGNDNTHNKPRRHSRTRKVA